MSWTGETYFQIARPKSFRCPITGRRAVPWEPNPDLDYWDWAWEHNTYGGLICICSECLEREAYLNAEGRAAEEGEGGDGR